MHLVPYWPGQLHTGGGLVKIFSSSWRDPVKLYETICIMTFGLFPSQERAAEEMKRWGDVVQYPGEDSYRLLTNKVTLIN